MSGSMAADRLACHRVEAESLYLIHQQEAARNEGETKSWEGVEGERITGSGLRF